MLIFNLTSGPNSGEYYSITSTKGGTYLQNRSYDFNNITGNLTSRMGLNSSGGSVTESFTYDDLNRLLTCTAGQDTLSVSYDGSGYGNITGKTDVGTYDYTGGVHNVTSVTEPTELMQNLPKQFIDYTKSGKVNCITDTLVTDEVRELNFIYGPDENRMKTLFSVDDAVVRTKYFALDQYEKETDSTGNVRELYYISGADGVVAVLEKKNNQDSIFYIHKDYLGSYEVISNQNGTVKERYNFDPWGRRRNPADWSYDNIAETHFLDRGFTGHEHLDKFGLINMNGRVFDPLMAMFLSPDNFVQSPDLTQNLNRYTYCLNNPLKFTDPSGYNYMQYMQQHYQNFDYRGGYYSEGTFYQASMGGGYGGYAPTTNISYDATHPHDLWSVGPGQGLNGNGLNGSYYDYYTGQYRSTSSMEAIDWLDVYDNAVLPYASAFIDVAAIRQYEKDQWNKSLTASLDGPDTKNVVYNIANTLNEFNPVAQLWDVIAYALTGKDRFGNSMHLGQGMLKAATIIPIGKIGSLVGQEGKLTYELIYRSKLGADGGISRHVIEKLDGLTISKTHQVFLEGKIIHQHQLHIGTYGTTRYFPEKWLNFPTIK